MNILASLAFVFALLQAPPVSAPATFTGIFRSFESGRLLVEVEGGQDMRMFVTRSTKFIRDGKASKASEFHDGDPVDVDAERDARMNMVALRVELAKSKPKPADSSGK